MSIFTYLRTYVCTYVCWGFLHTFFFFLFSCLFCVRLMLLFQIVYGSTSGTLTLLPCFRYTLLYYWVWKGFWLLPEIKSKFLELFRVLSILYVIVCNSLNHPFPKNLGNDNVILMSFVLYFFVFARTFVFSLPFVDKYVLKIVSILLQFKD